MNTRNDHDWAASRLTSFAAGLLPENDMLAMQEHLDSCATCTARLAPVRAADRNEAGHLPASLVATWNRSARRLSTHERDLVRRHLERCDSCRQTLVFAGHTPELPELPTTVVRSPKRTPMTNLRQWAFGVSAVAAAAAVWMLVVQPAMRPRDPRTSATMGGARLDAAVVWFEPPADAAAVPADAIVLPAPDGTSPLELEPGVFQTGRVLVLPADLLPPGQANSAQLTVTLLRGEAPVGAFRGDTDAIRNRLQVRSQSALLPGNYTLHVSVRDASGGMPRERSWALHVK
ncbi:MAG: zf-HC2 domain-containing protein [Candidatus Eisenbacteria bacterium]